MGLNVFKAGWSFLLSGACFALLFVAALWMLDEPLGMGEAYGLVSDFCANTIKNVRLDDMPPFEWQTAFLLGIFGGALLGAIIAGEWKFCFLPDENAGKGLGLFASAWVTPFEAFLGGFLVMLGLQFVGDSFLGQWTAAIQLSTSAWFFFFFTFLAGVGSTLLLKKLFGGGEGE